MQERRKLERFSLSLPAKIETRADSREKSGDFLELQTSNVSSEGAFFPTLNPLPEGMPVKISLSLCLSEVNSLGEIRSSVEITGKVCRSERAGMAVVFDNRYRIISET